MLRTGYEIGLRPIKTQAREGSEALKKIHYAINSVLYANSGRHIFQRDAENIYNTLVEYGKELKELQLPQKAELKREQIMVPLRTICYDLKKYKAMPQTEEDAPSMQKAMGFFTHKYIECKEKNELTPQRALELLEESRNIWDNVAPWRKLLKSNTFVKINGELLAFIQKRFETKEEFLGDD